MRARTLAAVAIATAAVALAGCHQQSPATNLALGADSAMESVVGVVRTVGVSAGSRLSLAMDDGSALSLTGPNPLRRVSGLRVMVRGSRADKVFSVTSFEVREAQGVPATDGILSGAGDQFAITTAEGRRVVVTAPAQGLKAMTGHRVWVARASNGQVVSYGLID